MSLQKTPLQDYIDYIQKEFGFVTSDNIKETFLKIERDTLTGIFLEAQTDTLKRFSSDMHKWIKAEDYINQTFKK